MDFIEILRAYKTIAIVGISDNPTRPSHTVAKYMIQAGYNIIPINPNLESVLGLKCYPGLRELPDDLKAQVEVVDIFRKPHDVQPVVNDAIAIGAKAIWMQLGITNEEAAQKAREAGLDVVQNHCIAVDHQNYVA